jgi:rubrerythrin
MIMSKLTDRISYLQGLAEGMKLNPDKDSHRLIIEILDVLGEVGDSFEALAEDHRELREYVDAIDEDLADLEAEMLDDNDEFVAPGTGAADESIPSYIEYECPHCGNVCKLDPDKVDFNEPTLCPTCKQDLFPEMPDEEDQGEDEASADTTEDD